LHHHRPLKFLTSVTHVAVQAAAVVAMTAMVVAAEVVAVLVAAHARATSVAQARVVGQTSLRALVAQALANSKAKP
jgi:hypothetical protein